MVPVMLQRLLELDDETRRGFDTDSLRIVPVSGSALSGELAHRFMDEFGEVVYNLYGSTEVAWVAIASPKDLLEAPGTAGRPPRNTELAILGDDDRPVRAGETGRIFVKNSMLFEGYTGGGSKDMVRGMMATGDVGRLDEEGRLFVEGRDDDMIVSGGENVFPQEVEETLLAHAKVSDAAVIGVDDERWGQALKAYVVKKGSVSEGALKKHVKEQLAGYKVPQQIEFIDELPRNPAGKVLKRELEDD
jgi:fatty-acyl-CoA synthase